MRVCVRVCVRIRLKSNITIMSNETLFWGFIDDLKVLGDDVKAQVLFGGCRWCEPSPIPAIVERLSKLDYKEIENIFPMVICNDMAKKRLQEEVCLLFNYHSECSQDLAYSEIDKVSLYARWLNRFILICGKFGMTDIIPLSKQDDSGSGRNEPQQYTEELISLFNGHTTYIDKLKDINNKDTIIQLLYKWCDLKLEDGKKICKDPRPYGNPTGYARGLLGSGVIPWENEGEKGHKKDINRLRQKISREG